MQHPLEVNNVKGSARLLHLCLPGSRLIVGEHFDAAFAAQIMDGVRTSLLLYPDTPSASSGSGDAMRAVPDRANCCTPPIASTTVQPGGDGAQPGQLGVQWQTSAVRIVAPTATRLIIIDATWRKSRKMLFVNPWLQTLPRLALHSPPVSQYRVRRAHRADQLSTFEAACEALRQCGADPVQIATMLRGFDGFIGQLLTDFKRITLPAQTDPDQLDARPTNFNEFA